jgi:hypothetical protein
MTFLSDIFQPGLFLGFPAGIGGFTGYPDALGVAQSLRSRWAALQASHAPQSDGGGVLRANRLPAKLGDYAGRYLVHVLLA